MTVIGVDLGLKGGWVALSESGILYQGLDFTRAPLNCDMVFVEKPLKNRKGTHIRALTSMHHDYGYFQGYLDAISIEHWPVEYHEWARVMLNGGKYPAAMRCRELWPENPEIAAHEGLADAALIAEYGRKLLEKTGDI